MASDLIPQLLDTVNRQARDRLCFSMGYRYPFVLYDDCFRRVEARSSGPLLGLSLTF